MTSCYVQNSQPDEVLALGLMSGTSLDGIDIALLYTDGKSKVQVGCSLVVPYSRKMRRRLQCLIAAAQRPIPGVPDTGCGSATPEQIRDCEHELTMAHVEAVELLLSERGLAPSMISTVGFHGQTVWHRPDSGQSWQIGNGQLLADSVGIAVVSRFRQQDLAAGGQGAPLVPLYHRALAAGLDKPLAIVNLGGVANITWLGPDDNGADAVDILAFDTGPGMALLDDWISKRTGQEFDYQGRHALAGRAAARVLAEMMSHPFLERLPPKSLDRNQFHAMASELIAQLSTADGAATLAEFTAACVARAGVLLPQRPRYWIICGGGRRNAGVLAKLEQYLSAEVMACEELGWNGDTLEAQAFAYLAVRSQQGRSLTLPQTTGVARPLTGGSLSQPLTYAGRPSYYHRPAIRITQSSSFG